MQNAASPRAQAKGLDIGSYVNPRLRETVTGDAARLRQVLLNLAGNAVKFTEAGAVLIEARPGETGQGLQLVIRDTGAGVPEHARARLFDAFSQVSAADARIDLPAALPPMAAGLVGYLAYDMVRLMEKLPTANPDPLGLPDGLMLRPTIMAIFDAVADTVTIVTPVRPEPGRDARAAYVGAEDRIARVVKELEQPLPHEAAPTGVPASIANVSASMTREAFHEAVRRARSAGASVPGWKAR